VSSIRTSYALVDAGSTGTELQDSTAGQLLPYGIYADIIILPMPRTGHAVAQWLRHYATNQKVAGSITDEVNF
jgi:hypothetical protein